MRHWSQQNKPRDSGRKRKCKRGRDCSSQRMAKEHEARDADAVEGRGDQCGLASRRRIGNPTRPFAPAMSWSIQENDTAARREPPPDGETQVFEIAACAMNKHDGELVGRNRLAKLHHVQLCALAFNEPS